MTVLKYIFAVLVSVPVAVAAFILLRNLAREIYRKP